MRVEAEAIALRTRCLLSRDDAVQARNALGSALPAALATAVPVLAGLQPADAAHPHGRAVTSPCRAGPRAPARCSWSIETTLSTRWCTRHHTVQTSTSRSAGSRMMIGCTVETARCALDISYSYRGWSRTVINSHRHALTAAGSVRGARLGKMSIRPPL